MHYHSAKGNLSSSSQAIEIEDKFDVLIDANDQLLEKVVSILTTSSPLHCRQSVGLLTLGRADALKPALLWEHVIVHGTFLEYFFGLGIMIDYPPEILEHVWHLLLHSFYMQVALI